MSSGRSSRRYEALINVSLQGRLVKMNLYHTSEFRSCLDLFSLYGSKNVLRLNIHAMKVFKLQMEIRRISHRRSRELSYLTLLTFANDGRKVYTDLQRKFKAVVLLAMSFEWKRSRCRLLVRELISKPRR